ncbi:MAG: hypothetical protein IJS90_04500, partial [Clostridia bacterium]|nr:hypothetical protein [Clostridia bacterium]
GRCVGYCPPSTLLFEELKRRYIPFAVLTNGSLIGKLPENSLTELWETSPLLKELREDQIPDDCSGCENAPRCGGGAKCIAFARTGDWRNRDPDCIIKR